MPDRNIDDKIKTAEVNFKNTVSEIDKTDDTFLNRTLLNLASRQNDLIYTYRQIKNRECNK